MANQWSIELLLISKNLNSKMFMRALNQKSNVHLDKIGIGERLSLVQFETIRMRRWIWIGIFKTFLTLHWMNWIESIYTYSERNKILPFEKIGIGLHSESELKFVKRFCDDSKEQICQKVSIIWNICFHWKRHFTTSTKCLKLRSHLGFRMQFAKHHFQAWTESTSFSEWVWQVINLKI